MNKTFRDVWKPPFHTDNEGYKTYIWDSEGTMAMNPNPKLTDEIIDCLNGETLGFLDNPEINNDMEIFDGEVFIGTVRGWGHVQHQFDTIEEAAKCQDEFAEWIINTLREPK